MRRGKPSGAGITVPKVSKSQQGLMVRGRFVLYGKLSAADITWMKNRHAALETLGKRRLLTLAEKRRKFGLFYALEVRPLDQANIRQFYAGLRAIR